MRIFLMTLLPPYLVTNSSGVATVLLTSLEQFSRLVREWSWSKLVKDMVALKKNQICFFKRTKIFFLINCAKHYRLNSNPISIIIRFKKTIFKSWRIRNKLRNALLKISEVMSLVAHRFGRVEFWMFVVAFLRLAQLKKSKQYFEIWHVLIGELS